MHEICNKQAAGRGSKVLNRDALAAFEPTALEYEAASTSGHSLKEAVDALTATFLWLIRSL
jgi:hypothetical protein